jgi:hypothetical protein
MDPRLPHKPLLPPRLTLPLGAVIVLLISFAVYYFVGIAQQEASTDDRAFRSLAAMSSQLRDVVSTYSLVFAGATREDHQQQKRVSNSDRKTGFAAIPRATHILEFLAAQAPKLADVDDCKSSPDADLFKGRESTGDTSVSAAVAPRANGYNLQLASNRLCAYVPFESLISPLITETPSQVFDDVILADAAGEVLYQTQRSGIVANRLSHLVLTSNQAGQAPANGALDKASNEAGSSTGIKPSSGHSASKVSSAEKTDPSFFGAGELSRVFRGTIAGADYRIYLVPVRLPVPRPSGSGAAPGARFVLCGLMLQKHFTTQSRSLPLNLLVWIVLAVGLVIVSAWPVLKFSTMRRSEQITKSAGLIYAVLATLSVMVAIVLVIHSYYGFTDPKTDNNMEDLAKAIDANVGQELSRALLVMDSVGATSRVRNVKLIEHVPRPCGSPPDGKDPNPETELLSRIGMEVSQYPYFRRLFIFDSQGFEHVRWTVDAEAPPTLRVCDRPYFQGVQRNDLWYLTEQGLPGARFRVDPTYSRSTGEYLAAIARPYEIEKGGKPVDAGVMTMFTPMLALIRPVLPPDYGFAVIDPTGEVLFHSDATKNGRENFFDELADSQPLREAVLARRRSWLREIYVGADYGLFSTPFTTIQGCPWSLLVFSNRAVIGDKELERIVLLGLLCTMYFLFLVAAAALLPLFLRCKKIAWPSLTMRGSYCHLGFVLGLVIVLFYAFIFEASPKELLCFAMLIPASAVVLSILKLLRLEPWIVWTAGVLGGVALLTVAVTSESERGNWLESPYFPLALICTAYATLGTEIFADRMDRWRKLSLATAYSFACYALLILAAGLPCVAFFKFSYDYDENLAVRRQQLLTLAALNLREEQVVGEYFNVNVSGASTSFGDDLGKWLFLRRRLQEEKLDLYDKAFRDQRGGQIMGDRDIGLWPQWWISLAAELASRRSKVLTSLVAEDCPDGGKWCWDEPGANRIQIQPNQRSLEFNLEKLDFENVEGSPETLALRKLAMRDPIFLVQNLTYRVDVLRPWDFLGVIALTLFGLLAAIFLSVRSTMTKMFVLKWNLRDAWESTDLTRAVDKGQSVILVGLPTSGKTAWLTSSSARVGTIDVAVNSTQPTVPPLPSQTIVALDHFEYGATDPVVARWKIALLEQLSGAGKTILIVTIVDPLFVTADAAQESASESAKPGSGPSEAANWKRVLARFKTLRLTGGSQPASRAYYNQLLWSTCTWDEKMALHSLAEGGWANHRNHDALQHLLNRGLIALTPELELTDPEFGKFVSGEVTEPERKVWRLHDTGGLWDGVRTALLVLLVGGLVALLFFSQKDILGLVTAAVGALTAAGKIVSEVKGGRTNGGKGADQAA